MNCAEKSEEVRHLLVNSLTPTVAIWVQLYRHPVPDRVKPSFVIFAIWAPWHLVLSARVPGCQKLQMNSVGHDAL